MQIKLDSTLVSPRVLREAQARTAYVLLLLFYFKKYFNDFRQADYLNTYQTDLHEIFGFGSSLAADE